MVQKTKSAGVLIIGNEILSGRTQDTNTAAIARRLNTIGIALHEVRVIPDIIGVITANIREFSKRFDYVFTTGGIGPTHDDKTAEAVAAAFDVDLVEDDEALQRLIAHYGGRELLNDGRRKMALVPQGASLIDNPVSSAPGFKIGNVYVMAGVPKIMESMLEFILPTLEGGAVIRSRSVTVQRAESKIADILLAVEKAYDSVEVGSYPKYTYGQPEVTVILSSVNEDELNRAYDDLLSRLQ